MNKQTNKTEAKSVDLRYTRTHNTQILPTRQFDSVTYLTQHKWVFKRLQCGLVKTSLVKF